MKVVIAYIPCAGGTTDRDRTGSRGLAGDPITSIRSAILVACSHAACMLYAISNPTHSYRIPELLSIAHMTSVDASVLASSRYRVLPSFAETDREAPISVLASSFWRCRKCSTLPGQAGEPPTCVPP